MQIDGTFAIGGFKDTVFDVEHRLFRIHRRWRITFCHSLLSSVTLAFHFFLGEFLTKTYNESEHKFDIQVPAGF